MKLSCLFGRHRNTKPIVAYNSPQKTYAGGGVIILVCKDCWERVASPYIFPNKADEEKSRIVDDWRVFE